MQQQQLCVGTQTASFFPSLLPFGPDGEEEGAGVLELVVVVEGTNEADLDGWKELLLLLCNLVCGGKLGEEEDAKVDGG